MKKNKLIYILIGLVLVVGAFIFVPLFSHGEKDETEPFFPKEPDVVTIDFACVGDVMAHTSQLKAQLGSDGAYSFTNNFKYVKDYISEADIAMCNVETTFDGSNYSGYPAFCSPDRLAEDLKAAGFDVAMTANNHMMDRGYSGLIRTIEVLDNNGFAVTGSVTESDHPRYAMTEAQGVKVAVIAYTYQTPSPNNGSGVYINGSAISEDSAARINSFSYENIDNDLVKIKSTVDAAKAAGAEIVAVYYHWGEEYQLASNKWQQYIAEQTAAMDVDMIFGSHPHTLQETTMIGTVPVFYSMGNFISNQRTETLDIANSRYTEEGVIAKVTIEYNKDTKEVQESSYSAIPTWVDRYNSGGKLVYTIVPLDENLAENADLAMSGHLSRAERAQEDAHEILGIN